MSESKHDWRAVISGIDPVAAKKIDALEEHTVARDSAIPRKYKELILLACSASIRCGSATRAHGCEAMYYGATDEEIMEVLSLASLSAGFTAFADGIAALGDQLTVVKE